jgi:hypothetical protein
MQQKNETVSFSRGGVDMISIYFYSFVYFYFLFFEYVMHFNFLPPYCFGDNLAAGVQVVVVGRAYMIDDLRGGKTECS